MNDIILAAFWFFGVTCLVSLIVWFSYREGKNSVIIKNNEKAKEVAHEQAKVAVNRPSQSDVVNSLRDGSF